MANFLTPMLVGLSGPYCCDPTTKRTPSVQTGDTIGDDETGIWTLYDLAPDPDNPVDNPTCVSDGFPHAGSVAFGIQCASSLTLHIDGAISPFSVNEQHIEVFLNGVLQWEKIISTFTTGDHYAATELVDEDVVIPLSGSPCGDVITVTATTGDEFAHNHIYWTITATIT